MPRPAPPPHPPPPPPPPPPLDNFELDVLAKVRKKNSDIPPISMMDVIERGRADGALQSKAADAVNLGARLRAARGIGDGAPACGSVDAFRSRGNWAAVAIRYAADDREKLLKSCDGRAGQLPIASIFCARRRMFLRLARCRVLRQRGFGEDEAGPASPQGRASSFGTSGHRTPR